MRIDEIQYCPSSLAEGFTTFSKVALRNLFGGKKVSHILDFESPELNEEVADQFRQNSKHISISGAQFKQSLLLEKNKLRLTHEGEQGQYILKPIPFRPPFGKPDELPANEHLTMQIAKQVFKIKTAECGLVFFKDGSPAYITKRFDVATDQSKIAQEDFASLLQRDKNSHGDNFKFTGSYEEIALAMKRYVSAYAVEVERFFELVVFNFLFSNADAHLKNFTLQQTSDNDYILSPAYDLNDTSIHMKDSFFALGDGLFPGSYETKSYKKLGFPGYDDFYEFGIRIGLIEKRLKKIMDKYCSENQLVKIFTQRSFLSVGVKLEFIGNYLERLKMLNRSFSGKI